MLLPAGQLEDRPGAAATGDPARGHLYALLDHSAPGIEEDQIEREAHAEGVHATAAREQQPFAGLDTSEDLDWGQRAAALGFPTVFAEEALVRHPARRSMAAGVLISMSRCFASSCVLLERMTRITSSMFAWASKRPCTVCFRVRARRRRNCVRRRMTVKRWRMNSLIISRSERIRGLPSTSASRITENES